VNFESSLNNKFDKSGSHLDIGINKELFDDNFALEEKKSQLN